ncbi:MAG: MAPEG family protein [Rhizomicrobium sp.]|jgi:uncharacterized MAPEG superfamily protein
MPIEIKYLLWAAALTAIQVSIAALGTVTQVGLPAGVGNRDDLPVFTGWVGRAHRAHRNMLESLVLFAIVVLVGEALNKFNATTALGAAIFFWSRLAYAVVYLIGVPWLRTLIWTASVVGLVMIFLQLV